MSLEAAIADKGCPVSRVFALPEMWSLKSSGAFESRILIYVWRLTRMYVQSLESGVKTVQAFSSLDWLCAGVWLMGYTTLVEAGSGDHAMAEYA